MLMGTTQLFDNAGYVCRYEDYYVDNDDDYEIMMKIMK